MKFNRLRDKAYKCAKNHGWHEKELSDEHCLCLVISELMEAVEADRKGNRACVGLKDFFQDDLDSGKDFKELFESHLKGIVEEELADACIRLLDLAGMRGIDLDEYDYSGSSTDDYSGLTFTEAMYKICGYITCSFYNDMMYVLLNEIFSFCKNRGIDIMWYIKQKMRYNELRSYKHGGKGY
ncbi:hypothetical protein [Phocaeicola plebeius]|jgi:NTP pyrophosphatase (non-canonical NTP hydrolase)|uniref:hypothetical protein n=1 Tax=Phocaeicola plebeius TaxID=310297 RepID=UPI0035218337